MDKQGNKKGHIHVVVFWVMMLCSYVVGYQLFREPHPCLQLQGEVKMEETQSRKPQHESTLL